MTEPDAAPDDLHREGDASAGDRGAPGEERADVELYLVRHAKAEARGGRWPDDGRRPLRPAGRRQAERLARALERRDIGFDRLFTSPWLRAEQTADALAGRLRRGRPEPLAELAGDDLPRLLAALADALAPGDTRPALVGHQPWLGAFGSLLLCGGEGELDIHLRKGATLVLRGRLEPAGMRLEALLPVALWE